MHILCVALIVLIFFVALLLGLCVGLLTYRRCFKNKSERPEDFIYPLY